MKNYSLDFKEAKTFVLSYEIKGNYIVINFATGEHYVIPYTIENEKKLLEKMKTQILTSYEFMSRQEKRYSASWKWLIFSASMLAFNVIYLISGNGGALAISVLCASWFAFDVGHRIYNMIDSKRNIKDLNKNKLLLDNEEKLNEKIKENPNILANTNEQIRKMVSSTPVEQSVFTLNNIDKVKYEELEKILENIDREEKFAFDYSSGLDDKPLVLTKKLK